MPIQKPFYRTCRPFLNGEYTKGGRWQYMLHKNFSHYPQHYERAFLLIQQDLQELFAYVEPSDINLKTYSHRIQQLLMRTCVEIEANFTAILMENEYPKQITKKKDPKSWTICDYHLINFSHRLSSFAARMPGWYGKQGVRKPFQNWENNHKLEWYQAYNASKHDRQNNFSNFLFNL